MTGLVGGGQVVCSMGVSESVTVSEKPSSQSVSKLGQQIVNQRVHEAISQTRTEKLCTGTARHTCINI
jgi:hypothetical protein